MALFKKREQKKAVKSLGRKKGIGRKIRALFQKDGLNEVFFEDLEDLLIESDLGGTVTMSVVEELRERVRDNKLKDQEEILAELKGILESDIKTLELQAPAGHLNFFLVLGVNGVGKTTTIAKLADYFKRNGQDKILLAAGDTFRAAAIDQLKIHGERTGFRVVAQETGSDPGAVMFDTIASAKSGGEELILADTAGRMHNRSDLVKELQKIDKVIRGNLPQGAQYKKLLVIDATTGQNGKHQAEVFHEAVGVDAIVMTKYDSTAKGGLVVSISMNPGIPFAFLGKGEGLQDLHPFKPDEYIKELLAQDD